MKRRTRKGEALFCLGALMIAAALGLALYNLSRQAAAGKSSESGLRKLTETVAERRTEQAAAEKELYPNLEMPVVTIDGYDYIGWIELPALELTLPVMSEWDAARLKIAPCRYSGSVYSGDLVIAAHNYASHFGRLSALSPGDEVIFTDADGREFRYAVADAEILPTTAVEEMTAGEWPLTLFTCTYGGRTRLTIRCDEMK